MYETSRGGALSSILLFVFTIISCFFSGIFGWHVSGNSDPYLDIAVRSGSALVFASFTLLMSDQISKAPYLWVQGKYFRFYVKMTLVACLFCLNWFSDFTTTSFARKTASAGVQDANAAADLARKQVADYEAQLQKLNADIAGIAERYPGLQSSAAHEARFSSLKTVLSPNGRNIWIRSKECTEVTLPESRDHCARTLKEKSLIGEAKKKESKESERIETMKALSDARRRSETKTTRVDASKQQVTAVVDLAFPEFQHVNWLELFVMASISFILSVTIAYMVWDQNYIKALELRAEFVSPRMITDQRVNPPRNSTPEAGVEIWMSDTPDSKRKKTVDELFRKAINRYKAEDAATRKPKLLQSV